MFTVKQFTQVSACSWTTVHVEEFPTLEEAQGYVKHTIDLDLEVECNCCNKIQIRDSNQKPIEEWNWCADDPDAVPTWQKI
tara:strand:- start:485 stop:727 length:243 start_codon:yes stop_codon:yes gene_type:complete